MRTPGTRHALWVLAVLAGVMFLRTASTLLIPVAVAVLFSYALEPVVCWLKDHGRLPRAASAAILLLAIVGLAAWGVYGLKDEFASAATTLPEAARRTSEWLGLGASAARQAEQAARSPSPATLKMGATWLVAAAGQITVVLFLTYFLLLSGSHFKDRILEITNGSQRRRITIELLDDINAQIQRFLLLRAVTAVIVAAATWAALAALGLEQAAVWGLMAGLFNSIPYFGPVIVSGGLFIVGLLQFGDLVPALEVTGAALAITSAEGWLLLPPLLGKAEEMHVVVVFLGLLVWTWVWGAWGTILAVPMLALVKAICDHVEPLKPVARLLAR